MSRNIVVTYELNPPADTPAQGLDARKSHTLPIDTGDGSLNAYYTGVKDAIARGKEVIGEELTAWRDAVGNREQTKESAVAKKGKADEEEDEDEDDQEEQEE